MVIAEAAAAGVPTVMHKKSIGASSMFSEEKKEIITTNMNCIDEAASTIIDMMENPDKLKEISDNAQSVALQWRTEDYGSSLVEMIERYSLCN